MSVFNLKVINSGRKVINSGWINKIRNKLGRKLRLLNKQFWYLVKYTQQN